MIIDEIELKDVEIEFGGIKSELGINGFIRNDILSLFTITIIYSKQEIQLRFH